MTCPNIMDDVIYRNATESDLPDLAKIYIDAVNTLGPRAYTPGQIAAWRRWPTDEPEEFRRRLTAGTCRVAEVNGAPVAFAEFTAPDHLDFLYTKGEFAGRGLASCLHQQLEPVALENGATVLRTEASYLSRPVFNRLGYEVIDIEDVVRFEEEFRRFKMRKILRPDLFPEASARRCVASHTLSFEIAPRVTAEEAVSFKRFDDLNWFEGTDPRGIVGYFPAAWFSIDEAQDTAVAQRDYNAAELTVEKGETLYLLDFIDPWARVIRPTGELGWVRQSCLEAPSLA